MKRLRVCAVAALASFASFVVAPLSRRNPRSSTSAGLGPESSFLWAVNNRNQAVGWSELAGRDTEHAILWQGGELIDLGALPGFPVEPRARHQRARADRGPCHRVRPASHPGDSLGRRTGDRHQPTWLVVLRRDRHQQSRRHHRQVRRGGRAVARPRADHAGTPARIHEQLPPGDQRCGRRRRHTHRFPRTAVRRRIRWVDGTTTALPLPPGATGASAEDVNARGTIVGYVTFPTGIEPAIWEGDIVAPLSGAWGTFSGIAWGINNRGEVVLNGHNFGHERGRRVRLASRARSACSKATGSAQDINDRGVAVGRIHIRGRRRSTAAVWPKALTRVPVGPTREE